MNNSLVKSNIVDVTGYAEAFVKSGLFPDTNSIYQAIVKIQAGQEIGIPPFQSMKGISVIKGNIVIGAGLMASKVRESLKYDYEVEKLENDICIIAFYRSGKIIGKSQFTIEDAKRAGTGASAIKEGYAKNIDKYPRNFLFARAMSNGVKWYCPDVFLTPVYVQEEADEISGEEQKNIIDPDYFFKEKFPAFYESWQLISTKEQLDTALEKLKNNPKWSDKLETQIFKDLLQRKMDQINQVITIETSPENEEQTFSGNLLVESLSKIENSCSRTELEIHKDSYINSFSPAYKAIFMKKYQDRYEILPPEKTDIQVSGSTPIFTDDHQLIEYATVNANKDGQ